MSNILHIRRFTLQAASPLSISSGDQDSLLDMVLARDVNGLPMIPAAGLTGALREALRLAKGEMRAAELFGFQISDQGERSHLTLTDALFHWSNNFPRDGMIVDADVIAIDAIASIGHGDRPVERDHVRINGEGVVDGDGKFTRAAVPKGARFTFEISEWGDGTALGEVAELVRAGLWLGGATRSGYGRMICVSEGGEKLDLATDEGHERYLELADEDLGSSLIKMETPLTNQAPDTSVWRVKGTIEGPLLVGGPGRDSDEDRWQYQEVVIQWDGDTGSLSDPVPLIPATAIKGPIRHRTEFYLRQGGADTAVAKLATMFGAPAKDDGGQAGMFRFHDLSIAEFQEVKVTHVSLDRFTGGARDHVLFTDAMLWRPELEIEITQLGVLDGEAMKTAFQAALADLASGQLGIGAEWGDGAGVFRDAVVTPPGESE